MFEKIRGFFMNVLGLFHNYSLKKITGIDTNLSSVMYNAIELWSAMMSGEAPWNDKAPPCGVLEQIAGRLSMLVSREIGLEVKNEAIKGAMEHIDKNVDKIVDYIALIGGCIVRPIFSNSKLQYETLPIGNYLPISYDFDETLTGALIMKQIQNGAKKWLLTEKHTYENKTHTVECSLYRNEGGALRKTDLTDCPQTADLTPLYEWENVAFPMIIEFRNHAVNKVDGSNAPVPIIAGAEDLIKSADEQFERMNWEQKGGEMRVFADRDMFQKRQKRNGETTGVKMTPELNRLLVQVEGDGSAEGKKITEHAPTLRTAAQNEMFQQILRRIELTCNIGKGTISDMESVQQTATQYSGGRAELYAIVDKIEDEIEIKYHHTAAVLAHMAAAYGIGANNAEIKITWNNDATRKDETAAKQMALQEISAGVKNKWEYRKDFYGEDEAQAKANTPEEAISADPFNFGA
jgi:A118 family predicted phage portal protein|nr:MAG TPA: portal protein [Caudoviricetes sp.]